ncbi:MAG TPA: ABC transporter ATP-binding protein [Allocoleopsis sp.]
MSSANQCDPSEILIELKGVSKSFGRSVILDKVDFTVRRGEAVAIIGPSGTGKSTILRIMCGLLAPDEGEVYIKGKKRERILEDADDPIAISLVFQQAALFDSLTVEENVGFVLFRRAKLPYKKIRELVNQKLEMVGLAGIGDRLPAQLSGGMRKRVGLARAIISDPSDPRGEPEVLLYDEPTAGLDPIASTVTEDVIRHLHGLKGGCSAYVIVTHQESTIRRTADRVVFLYQGKIQWDGALSEIDTTDNPWMRQFFSASTDGPIRLAG